MKVQVRNFQFAESVPPTQRIALIALVLCAHLAILGSWAGAKTTRQPPHEMSVSVALPSSPHIAAAPSYPAPPVPAKPQVRQPPAPQTVAPPIATTTDVAPSAAPVVAAPATPSLPDREPDFQAAYLNNPAPAYPLVARRMGWDGKVIVSVEVLANGVAGQVKVYQSSGHEALDNAALQAVRGWKFVAARQAGQLVNKWFLVPIPFILKDNE